MSFRDFTDYRNALVDIELMLRRLKNVPYDHVKRLESIEDLLVELQREV